MDNVAEIIKHGVISSVNPANATARVTFSDRDDSVSYDLPVMQHNTGFAKYYSMPTVGQNAICVFLGTGLEDGFILGSFYNDNSPPPITDGQIHTIVFDDGGKIEYSQGKFKIVGDVEIEGELTTTGDTVAGGISLMSHRHGGVQSGGSNTGGPQ